MCYWVSLLFHKNSCITFIMDTELYFYVFAFSMHSKGGGACSLYFLGLSANSFFFHKCLVRIKPGWREAQWYRALASSAEDLGLVPRTYLMAHHLTTQLQRIWYPLLSSWAPDMYTEHRHAYRPTLKNAKAQTSFKGELIRPMLESFANILEILFLFLSIWQPRFFYFH